MTKLLFLHTSATHISRFDRLLADEGFSRPVQHIVADSLLTQAQAEGLTPMLQARVKDTILAAVGEETAVCLCTCSTIGDYAEKVNDLSDRVVVLRVDRPMAEKAVALGQHIVVLATLATTFAPTMALLKQVAAEVGQQITITPHLCATAWDHFVAEDMSSYLQVIAEEIDHCVAIGDVLILAQASMAEAVALCVSVSVPILSSPRLGLRAALAMMSGGKVSDSKC